MTEGAPFRPIFAAPGTPPHELPMDGVRPVLRVATARRRLVGRLLDLGAVLASLALIFAASLYFPVRMRGHLPDAWIILVIVAMYAVMLAFFMVLRVGLVAWWGCTAGQRIAGLRVVDHPQGTPVRDWGTAFSRWFIIRGRSSLGPLDDLITMLGDRELRRCDHDQRAGTVVILAQAPLVPMVSSAVESPSHIPADGGVPYSGVREAAEGTPRIVLGGALGLVVFVAVALFAVPDLRARLVEPPEPPFTVSTFYEDEPHFDVRSPTGRSGTFDRTAAAVLDSASGCQAGAVDDGRRGLLRALGCQGRIEVAFTTPDRTVRVSGHLLRFADTAAATRAAERLRWTDLRFVPGGPVAPEGMVSGGLLDHEERYVVVTSVVAPKGTGMAEKAKNALILLHVPTVNTIILL